MERPAKRYFCNKCGYVGNVDLHSGCGYLAYHLAPFEQNYIDQLEAGLAALRASPASAPEGWKWRRHARPRWEAVGHWDSIEEMAYNDMLGRGWDVEKLYSHAAPTPPVSEGRKDAESTLEFICALEVRLIELAGELPSQNLMHKLSSLRQRVTDRKWELLRKAPAMQEDKP